MGETGDAQGTQKEHSEKSDEGEESHGGCYFYVLRWGDQGWLSEEVAFEQRP